MRQKRSRSVTRCDRGDADGSDARTDDLPKPAVDSAEVNGVDVKVKLYAGEAAPPDREQLAVGLGAPDEAERGDQEGHVAVVQPSTAGNLASGALESPTAPPDPAAGHLGRLRIPGSQLRSGMGPRAPRQAGRPPRRQGGRRGRDRPPQASPPEPGRRRSRGAASSRSHAGRRLRRSQVAPRPAISRPVMIRNAVTAPPLSLGSCRRRRPEPPRGKRSSPRVQVAGRAPRLFGLAGDARDPRWS